MISELTSADIGCILQNAPFFWKEINGDELMSPFNNKTFFNFLKNGFANDALVGWKYVENDIFHGSILFSKDYVAMTNCTILNEIFWWMSPEKRNTTYSFKLIKKAEEYAKLNQIDYVMMACMENPRPERLTQFYKRIGYSPVQTQFYKKIK